METMKWKLAVLVDTAMDTRLTGYHHQCLFLETFHESRLLTPDETAGKSISWRLSFQSIPNLADRWAHQKMSCALLWVSHKLGRIIVGYLLLAVMARLI